MIVKMITESLVKNEKYPKISGWNKDDYNIKDIDTKKYDVGILTGIRNNLIVLDVDIKDDGVAEINEYIKKNGDISTLTIQTPSGGRHYYFKYNSSIEANNHLINEYLTNKTKFRNKGLDIRSNSGYVKAHPSKGYEVVKNIEISEMPEQLLLWLLEDVEVYEKDVKTIKLKNNKKISTKEINKYNIKEQQLNNILSSLDKSYYTE
jgi:hypothetical protein